MELKKNIIIGLVLVVVVFGSAAWWYTSQATLYPFELAEGETISSWDFEGAYSDDSDLEKEAEEKIKQLNDKFGTEDNTDYILYVSLSGQYKLLGDGAKEYEYLLRALAEDSEKTGLAWHNLGNFLERYEAFNSARVAHENAVIAQPNFEQYQMKLLSFLTQYFPEDEESIRKAYVGAAALLGESPGIIEIRTRWLESIGSIEKAIIGWKMILELSPQSAAAVNAEIQRLEDKL